MRLVGLTGGIGSGKSTVAEMLAERGAVVIDADRLAREAVARGTAGFDAVVALFGPEVVDASGDLDRARIAEVVFADEDKRRALESIVHPEVARRTAETLKRHRDTTDVIVWDTPLLLEGSLGEGCDMVVVVRADPQVRLRRLEERGMTADDARARMATQMPPAEQAALADLVLDNDGDRAALGEQVDALWRDLSSAR
jgi:dephospho-CoA kinase